MAKYLLQSSFQTGTYNNPFKRGGRGFTYSAWKTEGAFAVLDEAKDAWAGFSQSGLKRRRVTLGGKTLVTPEGKVFEFREQLDESAAYADNAKVIKVLVFKEWMPGCRGFGL